MHIRRLNRSDIPKLLKIHEKFYNFPFPDIDQPLYAIQEVVEEEGKIILAGLVKLTSEGIFITDKDASALTRMKAIKLANEQMYKDVVAIGLEDCHTFAENDDHYINILRKLNWLDCTGHAMVRLK